MDLVKKGIQGVVVVDVRISATPQRYLSTETLYRISNRYHDSHIRPSICHTFQCIGCA